MLNLIGAVPDAAAVLAVPGAHLHLYGKEPRPGRKLGHVTLSSSLGFDARGVDAARGLALMRVADAAGDLQPQEGQTRLRRFSSSHAS